MGHYTQFEFWTTIRADSPPEVIAALKYLTGPADVPVSALSPVPNHPFFRTERWRMIGHSGERSLTPDGRYLHLKISPNCKNYGDEIHGFLDWLAPYVSAYGGWRGYWTHDLMEHDSRPFLIFFDDDKRQFMELYPEGEPDPVRFIPPKPV